MRVCGYEHIWLTIKTELSAYSFQLLAVYVSLTTGNIDIIDIKI